LPFGTCPWQTSAWLKFLIAASGCDHATVQHKPRLLSDNGPSYIAGELAEYIEANKMSHVRGAQMHPQTQGKIERCHTPIAITTILARQLDNVCSQGFLIIGPARYFALRRSVLAQNAADAAFRDRQFLADMIDTAPSSRRAQ
jgi:transposase InsO family protein